MNIVVCVKQVPDTSEVKIDPVTNNLVREGIPSIMNPYDVNAIEEALKIRDTEGGSVAVVSMGPPQATEVLQYALDMGADRAVLLSDRAVAGSDTLATGYALSILVNSLSPDLVLCGSEAIDGCTGQVGPAIAENLGFPQLTYVNRIIKVRGKEIEVSREVKEVYELLSCRLPAVVCILKGINEPRDPVPGTKKPETITAAALKLNESRIGMAGSPTRVAKIDMSGRRATSFVVIDSSLSADERIFSMLNGGLTPKKIIMTRGTPAYLAEVIFKDEVFGSHLRN
ncbi:electron transfer flavoprotein subunit beta [Spirochaetia bacterium]|nr:electron transfer flavoprotein subunit beta [Spirochaetia bacterium]